MELGLQDKLGKENFHEKIKKLYEQLTNTIEDTSRDRSEPITETSIKNNKAIENSHTKLLEILIDRGLIATYLMSLLPKITNPENTIQFKIVQDPNSNTVNDLLIHNMIPFTLYINLLTFHDTDKRFELPGDLLKVITLKNYKVDLAKISDEKIT